MPVIQLKDGRWIVQYVNPDPPPRLRREYFGRGLEGESSARRRWKEITPGPKKKRGHRDKTVIFETLVEAYILAKRGENEESTITALMYKLNGVILKELAETPIIRITPRRMDRYTAKRLRSGVKKTTVHREISDVMAILNWGVSREYISRNPLAGYKKPKRDDAIIRPVTLRESQRIIQVSPPHLVRALALCYYTGLRPGRKELLRLRWSDVDWDQEIIRVESARKGGIKFRAIPIHPGLLEALRNWHNEDMHKGLDYIITWQGRPVAKLSSAYATAKKKAGIARKLPLYAFRHAFATLALAGGGDLKSTSEILGHTRPDTTVRIYQHTNTKLHRGVIGKLPALKLD